MSACERAMALLLLWGTPAHIRSDMARSSPPFNRKLRDELLNREHFYTSQEAKVLPAMCRKQYNKLRPHSSLGYRPPAHESLMPMPGLLERREYPMAQALELGSNEGAGHGQRPSESCPRRPSVSVPSPGASQWQRVAPVRGVMSWT